MVKDTGLRFMGGLRADHPSVNPAAPPSPARRAAGPAPGRRSGRHRPAAASLPCRLQQTLQLSGIADRPRVGAHPQVGHFWAMTGRRARSMPSWLMREGRLRPAISASTWSAAGWPGWPHRGGDLGHRACAHARVVAHHRGQQHTRGDAMRQAGIGAQRIAQAAAGHAVWHQAMQVDVQVGGRAEALDQRDSAAMALVGPERRMTDRTRAACS